jgi:hypothetical protein
VLDRIVEEIPPGHELVSPGKRILARIKRPGKDVRGGFSALAADQTVLGTLQVLAAPGRANPLMPGSTVRLLSLPTRDILYDRFFLTRFRSPHTLLVFDQRGFRLLGSLAIPGVAGAADRLVRWGPDGLAFRTDQDQLFLIRSPLISGVPTVDPKK